MGMKNHAGIAGIAVLVAVVGRTILALALGFRPFDDTYISFRYALNLGTGHGFVYNWGDRVLGATTPLWILLLAAGTHWHLSLGNFVVFSAVIFDIVNALLIFGLLRCVGFDRAIAASAGVLLLLLVDYLALSISGMESSLFVLLVLACLFSLGRYRWAIAGILAGLALLTRPEALLLGPVFVAAALIEAPAHNFARRVVSAGSASLAVLLPWVLFAIPYFGSPIPHSLAAKYHSSRAPGLAHFSNVNLVQFFIHGQYGGGLLTRTYWQAQILLTAAAVLGAATIVRSALRGGREARLAAVLLLLFPALYVGAMGAAAAFTWFPWYYAPIYPFLAVMAVIGAARVGEIISASYGHRSAIIAGLIAVLATCQIVALLVVKLPAARADTWTAGWRQLSLHLPKTPDVNVAADEIGVLGWVAYPITVVDLTGLVSPQMLTRSPADYLRESRPNYVAVRVSDSSRLLDNIGNAPWFKAAYVEVAQAMDRGYLLFKSVETSKVGGMPANPTGTAAQAYPRLSRQMRPLLPSSACAGRRRAQ